MNPLSSRPLFHEIQRFRQPWLWMLLVPPCALTWYALLRQFLPGSTARSSSAATPLIALFWIVFGVGLPWIIYCMRLITEVRQDGLYVRFVPFHFRFIRFAYADLAACEARSYRPILEYGGWGLRYGWKGKAYTVSGNRGVQLVLQNGKRLLIGSQRATELATVINRLRQDHH